MMALVRTSAWSWGNAMVNYIGQNGKSVGLDRKAENLASGFNQAHAGAGISLANSVYFLDHPGTWVHDQASQSLYYHALSSEVDNFESLDTRLVFNNAGGIFAHFKTQKIGLEMSRIIVSETGKSGIVVVGTENVKLQQVIVQNSSGYGLQLYDIKGDVRVERTLFRQVGRSGVSASKIDGRLELYKNNFVQVGFFDSFNPVFETETTTDKKVIKTFNFRNPIDAQMNGITFNGKIGKTLVVGNYFNSIGYSGVFGTPVEFPVYIADNIIHDFCFHLNDGGAIYMSGTQQSTTTEHIIIRNSIRNGFGETLANPYKSAVAAGIYLDEFASHFAVTENKITGLRGRYSAGVYIHGGSHNYIGSNIIQGADFTGLRVARNQINDSTRGLVMSDNLFQSNQVKTSGANFGMHVSDQLGKFDEIVHGQTLKSLNSIQQVTDPSKSVVFAVQ